MTNYYQTLRTEENLELMKYPNAYVLLSLIAFRAKRTDKWNGLGLKPGEALIGDYKTIGLTRQKYRTALQKLKEWQFVTIKTTNKGTIAKITNTMVFNINIEDCNHQTNQTVTIKQPSSNHQATTNKNDKNVKNEKKLKQNTRDNSRRIIEQIVDNSDNPRVTGGHSDSQTGSPTINKEETFNDYTCSKCQDKGRIVSKESDVTDCEHCKPKPRDVKKLIERALKFLNNPKINPKNI